MNLSQLTYVPSLKVWVGSFKGFSVVIGEPAYRNDGVYLAIVIVGRQIIESEGFSPTEALDSLTLAIKEGLGD